MSRIDHFRKWPFQTKQSWLELAASENPGLEAKSLIKTNEDQVRSDPFSFHTDTNSFDHLSLPGSSPDQWKAGIEIGNENFSETNRFTQIALENGVEYIHFNFKKNISLNEIKSLLQGVYLHMISSRWTLPDETKDLLDISQYLSSEGGITNTFLTSEFFNRDNWPNCLSKFSFDVYHLDEWVSEIIQIIEYMAIHPACEKPAVLSIKFGNKFLRNIACVRALKAVLQKIISLYQFKQHFKIQACLDPVQSLADPYKNMIPLSSMSLSACLSGCDFIVPSKANYESFDHPEQWLKSAIHEQHILKQEARINGIIDPVSGSFFLDSLTREYAIQLWKGLQNKLKNDQ